MQSMMTEVRVEHKLERRLEKREPIIGSAYIIDPLKNDDGIRIDGVTANVSSSGACLYTCRAFDKGITITIYSKVFGELPRNANVVWCKRVQRGIFRIGISLS